MQRANTSLHSDELAKAAGVNADTIWHFEHVGILPKAERRASGYRVYDKSALERVHVVQRALRIGFTLTELADIFKTRDVGGAPCRGVFELAQHPGAPYKRLDSAIATENLNVTY